MDTPNDRKADIVKQFQEDVIWLRQHVPRDDIYEFAQQALIAAQFFIGKLLESNDFRTSLEEDIQAQHWIRNIAAIAAMKKYGFEGMVDTSIKILDLPD